VARALPASRRFWKAFNLVAWVNVAAYRRTGGRVGGRFGQARILLLHHVGRRSGAARVAPLLYLADGPDLVVVASKGGYGHHPDWFHNLLERPRTTVEVGRVRRPVSARVASEAERARLWPLLVAMYASFETYQRATERTIPVVILEPAEPG